MKRVVHSTLEDRLTRSLRPIGNVAPMPPRVLDVPDRWVRFDRGGWVAANPVAATIGVMAAAIVAALVVLTLAGPVLDASRVGHPGADAALPIERLDLSPQVLRDPAIAGVQADGALGDVVELARGRAANASFRLVAYRSGDGNCLWFSWLGSSGGGCGPLPEHDRLGDGVVSATLSYQLDPSTEGYLNGVVRADAERMWAVATDGRRAEATLVDLEPAGIAARSFLVFLPVDFEVDRVVVESGRGDRISEVSVTAMRSGVPIDLDRVGAAEASVIVVVRNHTDRDPILRMETRTATGEGAASSPVGRCDVATTEAPLREGLEWSASLDDTVVLDSSATLPHIEHGWVVEVVVDLRDGQPPAVGSPEVRSIEDSTIGPATDRGEVTGWSERMWELIDSLECAWEPSP